MVGAKQTQDEGVGIHAYYSMYIHILKLMGGGVGREKDAGKKEENISHRDTMGGCKINSET